MLLKYRPRTETNISTEGLSFNYSKEYLAFLDVPLTQFEQHVDSSNVAKFVFVTAASSSHLYIVLDAIATVQKWFPGYRIYYFDLDQSPSLKNYNKVSLKCQMQVILQMKLRTKVGFDKIVIVNDSNLFCLVNYFLMV